MTAGIKSRIKSRVLGLAVVALALTGGPVLAADFDMANPTVASEAVPPEGWSFRVTPYAWMTGINGSVTAKGRTVSTAMSFIDLVKDSDKLIPFMGYVEANKGRFSIFGDFFYSDLGFSGEKSKQVNPIAGLKISAKADAGLETKLTIAQVAAAYDIIHQGNTAIGVYAGARYWNMDADLSLKITGKVDLSNLGLQRKGKWAIAHSGSTDWVDPIVGLKVKQALTARDELQLAADIGGFGIGSKFSWQIFGGYSHIWDVGKNKQLAATLGYRILSVNYEEGSGTDMRGLDLTLHGPLAGLSLRF